MLFRDMPSSAYLCSRIYQINLDHITSHRETSRPFHAGGSFVAVVLALLVRVVGRWTSGTGLKWDGSLLLADGGDGCIGVLETTGFDAADCTLHVGTAEGKRLAGDGGAIEKLVAVLVEAEGTNGSAAEVVEERMDLVFASSRCWAGWGGRWCTRGVLCTSLSLVRWVGLLFIVGILVAEVEEVIDVPEILIVTVRASYGRAVLVLDRSVGINVSPRVECLGTSNGLARNIVIKRIGHHCAHHNVARVADHW